MRRESQAASATASSAVTASDTRNQVLSPRRSAASVPEVRVTVRRARPRRVGLGVEECEPRVTPTGSAPSGGPAAARRIQRHRELGVRIEPPEKAVLRRDPPDQHEGTRRRPRTRSAAASASSGDSAVRTRTSAGAPPGRAEETGQLGPHPVVLVPEMAGAEDPPGAVLKLEQGQSREPHGLAGPVEEVGARAGVPANGGEPEPVVARQLLRQRRQPRGHPLPLPLELGAQRPHGSVAPAARLLAQAAVHLAANAEREDGERHQHRDAGGQEEPGAEAHGSSTGRSRPSYSTVSQGTPRRTMALILVSISGINVEPGRPRGRFAARRRRRARHRDDVGAAEPAVQRPRNRARGERAGGRAGIVRQRHHPLGQCPGDGDPPGRTPPRRPRPGLEREAGCRDRRGTGSMSSHQ